MPKKISSLHETPIESLNFWDYESVLDISELSERTYQKNLTFLTFVIVVTQNKNRRKLDEIQRNRCNGKFFQNSILISLLKIVSKAFISFYTTSTTVTFCHDYYLILLVF